MMRSLALFMRNSNDYKNIIDEMLQLPPVHLTVNLPEAMESLKRLLGYNFDSILCYHGGVCQNGKKKLENLIRSYDKAPT